MQPAILVTCFRAFRLPVSKRHLKWSLIHENNFCKYGSSPIKGGDEKKVFAIMASALEQFVNNVRTLSKQGTTDVRSSLHSCKPNLQE